MKILFLMKIRVYIMVRMEIKKRKVFGSFSASSESCKTQIDAFGAIVTLSTLYPGLRALFRSTLALEETSPDALRTLWSRTDAFGSVEDLVFPRDFAPFRAGTPHLM